MFSFDVFISYWAQIFTYGHKDQFNALLYVGTCSIFEFDQKNIRTPVFTSSFKKAVGTLKSKLYMPVFITTISLWQGFNGVNELCLCWSHVNAT